MLMQLEQTLSGEFWTNVNDPRIAFNGIIELTNLNPRSDLGGTHLVYPILHTQYRSTMDLQR